MIGGGNTVKWSGALENALGPPLWAYEMERVVGVAPGVQTTSVVVFYASELVVIVGNDDFQQAVRGLVPSGCTFRGFPIAFNHASATKIFAALLDQPVAVQILRAHGTKALVGSTYVGI